MLITAYFKYASYWDAQTAKDILKQNFESGGTDRLLRGWGDNHEPDVVEIRFWNINGNDPHPFSFPYPDDVRVVARLTRAVKVFRKHHEIWPEQRKQAVQGSA